jgi:hypothetical protein
MDAPVDADVRALLVEADVVPAPPAPAAVSPPPPHAHRPKNNQRPLRMRKAYQECLASIVIMPAVAAPVRASLTQIGRLAVVIVPVVAVVVIPIAGCTSWRVGRLSKMGEKA